MVSKSLVFNNLAFKLFLKPSKLDGIASGPESASPSKTLTCFAKASANCYERLVT